jgi:hypothetical protein
MSHARKPDVLDFRNRAAVVQWLNLIEAAAEDALGVALDQTLPPAERELGRAVAARIAEEADKSIASLLNFARAGLGDEPDHGDPSGGGGSPD